MNLIGEPYILADLICQAKHPDVRSFTTGFAAEDPNGNFVFYSSCAVCKSVARETHKHVLAAYLDSED